MKKVSKVSVAGLTKRDKVALELLCASNGKHLIHNPAQVEEYCKKAYAWADMFLAIGESGPKV